MLFPFSALCLTAQLVLIYDHRLQNEPLVPDCVRLVRACFFFLNFFFLCLMFVLFLSISLKLTLVIYLFLVSFGSFNGKCIGTNYTQQLFTWFVSRAVHQDKNAKQKPQGRQSFNLVWPCLLSKRV